MAPVTQLGLLTLVSATLVAGRNHGRQGSYRHSHYHHPSGSGSGYGSGSASSSAAPYGYSNGTAVGPTGIGATGTAPIGTAYTTTTSTSTCVLTSYVSVVPVASSSANTNVAAASVDSSSTCGGTVYTTFTNTVTVTAGAASGSGYASASGNTAFYPGTSSAGAASSSSAAPYSAPFSSYSAPAQSSSSSVAAAGSSTSVVASFSIPAESSSAPASYSAPASSSAASYSAPASSSAASYSAPAYSSSASAATPSAYSTSSYAAPSSSSSSSSSAAPSSTGTSSGKRGCIYASDPTHCDYLTGDQVSWANNWVPTSGGDLPSGLTYVPQLHSTDSMWTDQWDQAASSGASVLAAFNEPDQSSANGGSGLSPSDAYASWDLMTKYQSGSVKITSPAVSSQVAPNMGLDWLQQFSKLGASWDITNIHFYGDCTNDQTAPAFNAWVESVYAAFPSKPVYVSEYGCYDGASDQQMSDFITATAQWMDNSNQSYVERYAFYKAEPGYLLNSASDGASSVGTTYTTCS